MRPTFGSEAPNLVFAPGSPVNRQLLEESVRDTIRDFEPRMALTGGADGLEVTRRIVVEAPRYLRPGGVLALEMGTGQTERVKQLFAEAGFTEIVVDKDYGGHERVVSGVLG